MPFTFDRTGSLFLDAAGGILWHDAYSGHGDGLNNPAMQAVRNVGPIPAGLWHIGRPVTPPNHLGPLAMPLTPEPGTDALGRDGFFIHGDNEAGNYTASDGCVVLPRAARWAVAESDDRTLLVV
jgi:hypothetical protein